MSLKVNGAVVPVGVILEILQTLGLDKVNNTTDLSKPISALVQAALDLKADKNTFNFYVQATAPTNPVLGSRWLTLTGLRYEFDGTNWLEYAQIATKFTSSVTAPLNPIAGDRWLTPTGLRYEYDGANWLEYAQVAAKCTLSETAPTNPNLGDRWYKASTNSRYDYNGSSWVSF